ncbi:MAG: hypothetical protein R3C99_04325 [Pirellulaceae bacterium]
MLTSLDDNAELDESTKTELRELYTQSVTRLEQLDASRASIQQSEQLIREASDENIAAAKEQARGGQRHARAGVARERAARSARTATGTSRGEAGQATSRR